MKGERNDPDDILSAINVNIGSVYIIITEKKKMSDRFDDKRFNSETVRSWYLKGDFKEEKTIDNSFHSKDNSRSHDISSLSEESKIDEKV